jgi:hypothetical protein
MKKSLIALAELVMLTISPTHSVLLREGAPGVVAWDPNQQGKRAASSGAAA